MRKKDFPVSEVRRFLEPGPTVLITSAYKDARNVMTMNWHTVLEFSPSLVGLMIAGGNYTHGLLRKSKECVINIPQVDMIDMVAKIGNCSGDDVDKFAAFDLKTAKASKVKAPLLADCFANFECKLDEYIARYNFFIFRVVKAHVAAHPKYPKTMHYRGEGVFMTSGDNVSRARLFKPEML